MNNANHTPISFLTTQDHYEVELDVSGEKSEKSTAAASDNSCPSRVDCIYHTPGE